ncbi:MAG: DUF3301 domain-containing protein [Gammaproteobacteria bacterium]
MSSVLLLVFTITVGWFWLDSMRMRETAVRIGAEACRRHDVQFLDDTVALHRLGLDRDGRGHLRIRRTYQFDFSESGDNRRRAYIIMIGAQLDVLQMGLGETSS